MTFGHALLAKRIVARSRWSQTGCLEWSGPLEKAGYGKVSYFGRGVPVHRALYMCLFGELPREIFVCHTCDNRACVNPDHLFRGSVQDNNADKTRKGRAARLSGERNPNAKLTAADVRAIRASPLGATELSKKYGVVPSAISAARLRRKWKHV